MLFFGPLLNILDSFLIIYYGMAKTTFNIRSGLQATNYVKCH